jgi:hypothetical protein
LSDEEFPLISATTPLTKCSLSLVASEAFAATQSDVAIVADEMNQASTSTVASAYQTRRCSYSNALKSQPKRVLSVTSQPTINTATVARVCSSGPPSVATTNVLTSPRSSVSESSAAQLTTLGEQHSVGEELTRTYRCATHHS